MELNEAEQKDLRIILENVFGFQDASRWRMNAKVLELTAQMVQGAERCSEAMNYVPRPGIADSAYFRRELRNFARRAAGDKKDMYQICAQAGARLKWKSALDIASQGF